MPLNELFQKRTLFNKIGLGTPKMVHSQQSTPPPPPPPSPPPKQPSPQTQPAAKPQPKPGCGGCRRKRA